MASIELELKPFMVPNFAIVKQAPATRQDGMREAPSIPLSELSPQTLDELCREFRREVFAKAGKRDPRSGDPK